MRPHFDTITIGSKTYLVSNYDHAPNKSAIAKFTANRNAITKRRYK